VKKIKSYNLSKVVIDKIHSEALLEGRKDSDYLDRYLLNEMVRESVLLPSPMKIPKTKKAVKARFDFKSAMLELGVDPVVLSDWLEVRKKKKASNTETAFKAIISEISKSGLPADIAIVMAAENSWAGFKASWVNRSGSSEPDFSDDKTGWTNQDYGLIR